MSPRVLPSFLPFPWSTTARSVEEVNDRLMEFLERNPLPSGKVYEGGGWDQTIWNPSEFPHRRDLDDFFPDIPGQSRGSFRSNFDIVSTNLSCSILPSPPFIFCFILLCVCCFPSL